MKEYEGVLTSAATLRVGHGSVVPMSLFEDSALLLFEHAILTQYNV